MFIKTLYIFFIFVFFSTEVEAWQEYNGATVDERQEMAEYCTRWEKVAYNNYKVLSSFIVRRTVGLSGDKYGGPDSPYKKVFPNGVGKAYMDEAQLLMNTITDRFPVVLDKRSLTVYEKAKFCEQLGEEISSKLRIIYTELSQNGKIP